MRRKPATPGLTRNAQIGLLTIGTSPCYAPCEMRSPPQKPMSVHVCSHGARRYAVHATLQHEPMLEMSTALGYNSLMPHDLQHFIVERAFGIRGGILGQ